MNNQVTCTVCDKNMDRILPTDISSNRYGECYQCKKYYCNDCRVEYKKCYCIRCFDLGKDFRSRINELQKEIKSLEREWLEVCQNYSMEVSESKFPTAFAKNMEKINFKEVPK